MPSFLSRGFRFGVFGARNRLSGAGTEAIGFREQAFGMGRGDTKLVAAQGKSYEAPRSRHGFPSYVTKTSREIAFRPNRGHGALRRRSPPIYFRADQRRGRSFSKGDEALFTLVGRNSPQCNSAFLFAAESGESSKSRTLFSGATGEGGIG